MDDQRLPSHHSSEDEKLDAGSDRQVDVDGEKGMESVQPAVVANASPAAPPAGGSPGGPPGGPVPNGGAQAWLQVLGSWMLFFNTWVHCVGS